MTIYQSFIMNIVIVDKYSIYEVASLLNISQWKVLSVMICAIRNLKRALEPLDLIDSNSLEDIIEFYYFIMEETRWKTNQYN